MAIRQTRIFVPYTEADDWAETLIGRVVHVVATEFEGPLRWFWFTRYTCLIGMPGEDREDCDFDAIDDDYKQPLPGRKEPSHRSIRLRFEIEDSHQVAFESRLRQLVKQLGYAISDVGDYNYVLDLGGARFLGEENRLPGRDVQRARLVVQLCHAISLIVLDALVGPDSGNRYRLEYNKDQQQNPHGSTFESLHHLFCNITEVPVSVLLATCWGAPKAMRQVSVNGLPACDVYLQY